MQILSENALNIRYIKLHFTLQFVEDTILPQHKGSAIRGGIGEMLLRANCVRSRQCDTCDFTEECIVQRTMYSKIKNKPAYMTQGESVGYVVECENYRQKFQAGDLLKFNLLLFGKNICYFNLYLQAISALGMNGLGKYHSRFQIVSIENSERQSILGENNSIYMERYRIQFVRDYVEYRLRQKPMSDSCIIHFQTPMCMKYRGIWMEHFSAEAVIEACARRIHMLDCFEELDEEQYMVDWEAIPPYTELEVQQVAVPRYSNRKETKMLLKGIKGSIQIENVPEEWWPLLYAGELMHIGKNSSFGFGRYRCEV